MELNFELEERRVDTKDKRITEIIIYQVEAIKEHYNENLELIMKQFLIADQLVQEGRNDDAETIWRTQIVLLASAFDFFMHEIIWYGLDKIYDGDWSETEQYQNLSIRLSVLHTIMEDMDSKEWFVDFITAKYKTQTLMAYSDVKDHLNLIGVDIKNIANNAFYLQGCDISTNKQMKEKLDDLYHRRNYIAHQSDRSERNAERKDISKEQVKKYVGDINKIVLAIIEEVKKM